MYNATGQLDREQTVQRFAPLVKRIAYHLMSRLPSSVQVDDVVQNGMITCLMPSSALNPGSGRNSKPTRRSVFVAQCSTDCARTTGCRAACAGKCAA